MPKSLDERIADLVKRLERLARNGNVRAPVNAKIVVNIPKKKKR